MKIIKLDAIDSTNSFLKELAQQSPLENYTVVVTNHQTKGRGQTHTNWTSEPFKNLTFSTLITNLSVSIDKAKYINYAASLAVFNSLQKHQIQNLSIKWPNDILSANKKVCGILVENTFRRDQIKNSIVGIGLNVNQTMFPEDLKNVSSLQLLTDKEYNLDALLLEITGNLKDNITLLNDKKYDVLEQNYLAVLYKKNIPAMFKDANNQSFLGKIIGISKTGELQIQLEDETVKNFGIKEVSFL